MNEKIILPESPEAAELVTVKGWKPRGSEQIFEYESLARNLGKTHDRCEKCEFIIPKAKGRFCDKCGEEYKKEQYCKFKIKEWDRETPLVLYQTEEYFYNKDEVLDFCHVKDIKLKDLKLMICEHAPKPDIEIDYIYYYLDGIELSKRCEEEIVELISEYNHLIHKILPDLWQESKYRTSL